jgi:RNA polymerase sigma-70 factor (ECF subfamily)
LLEHGTRHLLRTFGEGRLLRHDRGRAGLLRHPGCAANVWLPVMSSQLAPASSGPTIDWSVFYQRLHGYVAARVRSAADADDLVQLILERAMSKAASAEIENVAGWLFGIARNAIADHHRAQAKTLITAAEALESESALGSEGHERTAVLACMEPLLNSLPSASAQLLRWADMEGRSMQAIAGELAITLSAAKSRVQRARQEFLAITSQCCSVTIDARGRVTELTPKKTARASAIACEPCAPSCSDDGNGNRS